MSENGKGSRVRTHFTDEGRATFDSIFRRADDPVAAKVTTRPATEVISPITDPMGAHWDQPDRSAIRLNDTHAFMTKETLEDLEDYSCSQPSGVYPGKMWRSSDTYDRKRDRMKPLRWWLRWFDVARDGNPNMCSNHTREIVITP